MNIVIKKYYDAYAFDGDTFKLNDRLSEDLRTANGKIYELQQCLAAIEGDAVEFAFVEWCSTEFWVYQLETGKWYNHEDEEPEYTTADLYKLFKNKQ